MADGAIFLDRDDTLIQDPGYINHPDQVRLIDGVAEALIQLRSMGFRLVVVSNQSAVARGIVTEQVLKDIHARLEELLAEKGASLDRIYYCPYHTEGVIEKYRLHSDHRKPAPGMLMTAADQMDLDLAASWIIGDSLSDIEAGKRAGCRTILLDNPAHNVRLGPADPKPDYRAVNMKEAANIIRQNLRTPPPHSTKPPVVERTPEPDNSRPPAEKAKPPDTAQTAEDLLREIAELLRNSRRTHMFTEFSTTRLIAGAVQVFAVFAMLVAVWLLLSPERQNDSVLISLAFAIVLQVMSLTFYVMSNREKP